MTPRKNTYRSLGIERFESREMNSATPWEPPVIPIADFLAMQDDTRAAFVQTFQTGVNSLQQSLEAEGQILEQDETNLTGAQQTSSLLQGMPGATQEQRDAAIAAIDAAFALYGKDIQLYGSLATTLGQAETELATLTQAQETKTEQQVQQTTDAVVALIKQGQDTLAAQEQNAWQAALRQKTASLQKQEEQLVSQIAALEAQHPFANPAMVTPTLNAKTVSSDPKHITFTGQNMPAGVTVSASYGKTKWSQAFAEGSSAIAMPISALGHNGQGSLEVQFFVTSATGQTLDTYTFYISGDHTIGDPRNYNDSFSSLAHSVADPAQPGRQQAMTSANFQLSQTIVQMGDVQNGILADLAPNDPRVAQMFLGLQQVVIMQDRGMTGTPPPVLIQDYAALPAGQKLAGTVDQLSSPDQLTMARSRANALDLVDPASQTIYSEVALAGKNVKDLAWSADGKTLAYVADTGKAGAVEAGICNLTTQTVQRFALSGNDTATSVTIGVNGEVIVGLGSGSVRLIAGRNGTMTLISDSISIPGVMHLSVQPNGIVRAFTASQAVDLLIDGSRGTAAHAADSTSSLSAYAGQFARFSYQPLAAVNTTGLGQAQMGEAVQHALAGKLYTYDDTMRFAQILAPDLVGSTPQETLAKEQAWAKAHGVSVDIAEGERMKVLTKVQAGIDQYNALVTKAYTDSFWIVHDLLTATDKTSANQRMTDIMYGAAGGQILSSIWTPQLPTMKTVFYDVYNTQFDKIYNAALGVNQIQTSYWISTLTMNTGSGGVTGVTQRQISTHEAEKINYYSGIAISNGDTRIGGTNYTVSELQQYSSATPSSYVATASRPNPADIASGNLTKEDAVSLLSTNALFSMLNPSDPVQKSVIDGLSNDSRALYAMNDPQALQELVSEHVAAVLGGSSSVAQARLTVNQMDTGKLLTEELGWYKNGTNVPKAPEFIARDDTWAGRIFLGLLQQLQAPTVHSRVEISAMAEKVLGISADSIMALPFSDVNAFSRGLKRLFSDAGYGDLFASTGQAFQQIGTMTASTDKNFYNSNESIGVHWDLPATIDPAHVLHVNIYVLDGATGEQIDIPAVSADISGRSLSASIPVSAFQGHQLMSYSLRVVVWMDTKQPGVTQNDHLSTLTPQFLMQTVEQSNTNDPTGGLIDFVSAQSLAGNTQILNYIAQNFTTLFDLKPTANGWIGDAHGTGIMQCKEWIDDVIIKNAFGFDANGNRNVDLPGNVTDKAGHDSSGQWEEKNLSSNISIIGHIQSGSASADLQQIKPGDILQTYNGSIEHTAIVTKITSTGMWLLDTNFGNNREILPGTVGHELDGNLDANGVFHYLTPAEIANGVVAHYHMQEDDTIRLHFMPFTSSNGQQSFDDIIAGTIYRINQ